MKIQTALLTGATGIAALLLLLPNSEKVELSQEAQLSQEECQTLRQSYAEGSPETWIQVNSEESPVRRLCKGYQIDFPG
jgi:hypothetical protein